MSHKIHKETASHKLNEFGFIDHKKPLGQQQNMRTSNYFGHKVMNDTMLGDKIQKTRKETRPYVEDPVLETYKNSDYKTNFIWKFGNPDEIRNVALDQKINYIKPFYDCNIKFLKRSMRPASSVTHSDFLWHPETVNVPLETPHIPTAVASTKIFMEYSKPGYSKYLDPSATTTRLDYCYHSPTDIMHGIAAKDNITFWNWKDIECSAKSVFRDKDTQLCDKLPSSKCVKRRCEFPSNVKHVPNSGLTTEVREHYMAPNDRAIEYNIGHIRNT